MVNVPGYKSNKSIAATKTTPIIADDPKLSWENIGLTKKILGSNIDYLGLDGKMLIAGGTGLNSSTGISIDTNSSQQKTGFIVPGSNGNPSTFYDLDLIVPTNPTNVQVVWSGNDLVITFDWDFSNPINSTVSNFILEITGEGTTRRTAFNEFVPNKTQTQQTLTLTKQLNELIFGNFTVDISAVCVLAIDPFYNYSSTVCAPSVPAYVLNLPVPEIIVTAINGGYNVAYTTPDPLVYGQIYDAIEIVEYESDSSTEPTGVTYTTSYWNSINPATVIVSTLNPRWVKARFSSHARIFTDYCAAQKITPVSPVSVDLTPPNEVTAVTAAWSGDNIVVNYTLPATDAAARVQVQLTSPNSLVGYFYAFPSNTGLSQSYTINKTDLFNQFGEHYSSYTGLLKSIDAADNRSAGVSFNTGSRPNPLLGVTPYFAPTAMSNGYSVTITNSSGNPTTLPTGAVAYQVYSNSSSYGSGNPTIADLVGQFGTSYTIITDINYVLHYLKIRYIDDWGNVSSWSTEQSVTPINPSIVDLAAPITPTVTGVSSNSTKISITISTTDTSTRGYSLRYKISTDTNYTTVDIPSGISFVGGTSVTAYDIITLIPGKTYNIDAAAYDQYNNLSAYSTDINYSTTSPTVPVVTSATVSGLSYGLLASWTAPTGSTTTISKYRVELYNSTGVLLQTSNTFSTNASFTGLTASTTYYVKIYTVDIYGFESAAVTSSNITLNANGGTTNGSAPSSSPAAIVNPLYGALEVKWTAISNADPVTYEVHVSTTTGFTPSSATKALETTGTFAVIKTLPGTSTALTYGTTYYVKLIATDFDGSAAAGTQGSAAPLTVSASDITANTITANKITAGTITSTEINSSSLLVSKLFAVGTSTDLYAIKIDATANTVKLYSGTGTYQNANTGFYLDTSGKFSIKDKLWIDGGLATPILNVNGSITAQSGDFQGAMTLNNGTMKIGKAVQSTNDGIYIGATGDYIYTTGNFRLGNGGVTWNGTSLAVAGTITATGGSFTGNILMSGGAIYSGTPVTATISGVVGNGATATYTTAIAHGLSTGNAVRIAGLSNNGFNVSRAITVTGTTTFTIPNTTNATITGQAGTIVNISLGYSLSTDAMNFGGKTVIDGTTGQIITTSAVIGGWTVDTSKLERFSTPNYTGFSTAGTYAIYAGSTVSGAATGTPAFGVKPDGSVQASSMQISGGTLDIGAASPNGFHVTSAGALTATGATINGAITATSGSFTGNVSIGVAGSLYALGAGGTASSGIRTIFNAQGVAAYNAAGGYAAMLTSPLADGSVFQATAANIGGWSVSANDISKTTTGNGKIKLDATNGYIAISNTADTTRIAGINAATTGTDSVFWSGGLTPNDPANPFRVTFNGTLYALDANITGKINASSGGFGTIVSNALTKGWTVNGDGLLATGLAKIDMGIAGAKIIMGNYNLYSDAAGFKIYDGTGNILSITDNVDASGFNRIFLGQAAATGVVERQVEVAKNAEISGAYSGSAQDYRSGGLRNMFTITTTQFANNPTAFPLAGNGSVLLVYTP